MPVMSVVDRSDARASARVLAKTAKRCIDGELEPTTHRTALNNLFRLLNAYKSHRFVGYEYEANSPRGPEALTLMPAMDRRVVDLRRAIEGALSEIYGDQDSASSIEQIDDVIRCVGKTGRAEEGALAQTSRFLGAFIDRLAAQ